MAWLVLVGVGVRHRVSRAYVSWVTYWPALAYLGIAGRALARWQGWRWLATAARRTARLVWTGARRVLVPLWRWAGPWCRDAGAWLVHIAPRLAARLAWRGVRVAVWWLAVRGMPGVVRLSGLAVVGAGWLLARIGRYVLAYRDYGPLVRELEVEGARAHRVKQARDAWRRTAYRRLTLVTLLCGGLALGVSAVVSRHGAAAGWAAALTGWAVLAGIGRARRPRSDRPGMPAMPEPDPTEPFPIADAHTRAQAADCVSRAVTAEGIELRAVESAQRRAWGWETAVVLRKGTPAGLVAKVAELETTLDLPSGGVLAAPDRARRARVVLRLAERDPFAGIALAPDHPPASLSLRDPQTVGVRMTGEPLRLSLLGVHGVVIGGPGSGKSQTLRTLADAVSACVDAVVWDLDPAGNGLEVLGGAVARSERDARGVEDALAEALAMAEARPKLLSGLGMGDAWDVSAERPAVIVFCDEYPRLSDRAKSLAVDLIRVGRKARVTVILASSEATSDTLGAAVAEFTALKVMHACRHADVRLTLGANMVAEGWRPDRLNPATGESPEDAGVCYVHAAGARDPILNKISLVPSGRAKVNGSHRAARGLPRIDVATRDAARALTPAAVADGSAEPVDQAGVADVLAAFGADDRLWTDTLLSRLADVDGRYRGWTAEDLAGVLAPLGVRSAQVKIGQRNRNGYRRDPIQGAWEGRRSRGEQP
ncbi:hypothetical protein ACFPM7_22875 [Actinokineospora guangxiensis]|uniref:AAA+ ATPase domain-containing protein n=1 Tax=Actinokineospora guangxiensis TaxID=1490288 RepID=A0ABW0EUS0_9PSEU